MPTIHVTEDEVLRSLTELGPAARREAMRCLLPSLGELDSIVERNQARIAEICRSRGLKFADMDEAQREKLVDAILHGE